MTSCRVVTWNLWWRFGDRQRRFEVIAAELASVAPDFVGLQEVWARGEVNAAGLLARRLGMHWAWVPSPHPQRWQRRVGDCTRHYDIPAGRLPFFTTQLRAFPGRSGLRCAQVRRVAEFVASHSPEAGLPAAVTGDLNAVRSRTRSGCWRGS